MSVEYKVQKGDTLSAIGRKYGVDYKEIARVNGISNPDLIYAGSTLVIPGTGSNNTGGSTGSTGTGSGTQTGGSTGTGSGSGNGGNTGGGTGTQKVEPENTPTTTQTTASQPVTTPGGFTYNDFSYASYAPSTTVQQANNLLNQHQANKPGSYTPVWQDEADSYLAKYQNRDPFSYNFNTDALYNQYKDMYIQQGQLAMMDTMGQAAAMTGGYGNSYAATAGQQAYNNQLGRLNDVIPELWQRAYDRYNQEGQNLLDMYGMYMDKEALEYSRYQDSVDDWYRELNNLQDNYNTLSAQDYDMYLDRKNTAYDEYSTDRAEEYQKYLNNIDLEYKQSRDQVEDERYASETDRENGINKLNSGTMPNADELKAMGNMTSAEAQAIIDSQKAGNTSKYGSTSNSTKSSGSEHKELEYGSNAYNNIVADIKRAKSLEELEGITNEVIRTYGEDAIYNMYAFQSKLKELGGGNEQIDTGVGLLNNEGSRNDPGDEDVDHLGGAATLKQMQQKRLEEKYGVYIK